VFKGTYRHRIDPKGRVPVPAAFRRGLDDKAPAVVLAPLDQCLAAYPPGEWLRVEEQLRALPTFSKPAKALTRLLTSRAIDCELDGQGRILLPAALRAAAGLDREALVIGVLNRFELWAPDRWDAFVNESERLLEDATLDVPWPTSPSPSREAVRQNDPQEKPKR
jgi:MraZ protein